ncbi:MAG: FAD-dependent oxidoreductase [Pseudoxanthomonas sp.]
MRRVAVVGGGIAGMGAAWRLSQQGCEVTLFEAGDYLGGHTQTHDIALQGRHHALDTGFIVFNLQHYPLLTALFDTLGVTSQPTTMSFSVRDDRNGLEYNAGTLGGLFCQKRNLVSPRFWRMLGDLRRFYREAPTLLSSDAASPTLGEYLQTQGYSDVFRDDHLVPMASALWSSPSETILAFPARHLVAFMANHHMLQVTGRPEWRVVRGGSQRYVDALRQRWTVDLRLSAPVRTVRRYAGGVSLQLDDGVQRFDDVVLACHADDALALLSDADEAERVVLSGITYQPNEVVLHTDASLLPRRRAAWAAWNAHVPRRADAPCSVSYWMNALQSLDAPVPFIVTLNPELQPAEDKVLRRLHYRHPHQTHASVAAQARLSQIQGQRSTFFAGAGWGFGFHEDGLRSGYAAADAVLSQSQSQSHLGAVA